MFEDLPALYFQELFPKELTYIRHVLSWEDQNRLLSHADSIEWSNKLNQRTRQVQCKFNWRSRSPERHTAEYPLRDIAEVGRRTAKTGFLFNPDQAITNGYFWGQGIRPKTDLKALCNPSVGNG